jgi:hypothetical protein
VNRDVGQGMIAGLPVGHITDLAVGLGCRAGRSWTGLT